MSEVVVVTGASAGVGDADARARGLQLWATKHRLTLAAAGLTTSRRGGS